MVLKECFDSTATIAAVLLFIITVASFAEPAESCSLGYENGTLIACEEGTEKEPEAKPEETFPWKDIRLPSFIEPVHYDLFMDLNLETFENSGQVNITFQVTNATNFIVLHSKDLNLLRILVLQDNETIIPVLQHLEYPKHQQLYIKFDGTFIPDLKYKLRIDFRRHLEESMEGFYVSSYTTSDGEKRYLATTQFQPTAARSAFPCFDEPAMKATFQLKMVHDVNYRAYFNSEILQIAPYSEGRSISSFQKTVKMSTYLVAFIVCDFREREITNLDGVDIRVLVPSEQCEESEYALELAADILDFYQTFFNISYPLSKLDMAAIPDFAYGAMENWGLVSFRLVAILYSPSETSANNQGIVASVISHELAHQWFGNLVTMQWWNDLWLNEGFASFMQYIALDSIRSEWDM
ncbi:endoplasmic reticulum aminopeptidase 2-like, partial [Stegodyphus dumicola]|uniref:endoplasmic reticulum aminopeptidase 2-like n=1 Tax=Stegodyphus dumicola TaxID=202533 RepID=UPI0015AFA364